MKLERKFENEWGKAAQKEGEKMEAIKKFKKIG